MVSTAHQHNNVYNPVKCKYIKIFFMVAAESHPCDCLWVPRDLTISRVYTKLKVWTKSKLLFLITRWSQFQTQICLLVGNLHYCRNHRALIQRVICRVIIKPYVFLFVRYRFMAMDRLGTDLQKVCEHNGGRLKKTTVLHLGQRLVRRSLRMFCFLNTEFVILKHHTEGPKNKNKKISETLVELIITKTKSQNRITSNFLSCWHK